MEPASQFMSMFAGVSFHFSLTTPISSFAVTTFAPDGTNMNSAMMLDLAAPVASSQILARHIVTSGVEEGTIDIVSPSSKEPPARGELGNSPTILGPGMGEDSLREVI